jgi:hypothetical protein
MVLSEGKKGLPSPLLQTLSRSTQHQSVKQRLGREESLVLEERDSESDLVHAVSLLGGLSLDQSFSLEGSEFVLNLGALGGLRSQEGERLQALLLSTSEHEPSRRVREPDDSDTENEGGDELDSQGNSPGSIRLVGVGGTANVVGAVSDPVRDEDTDYAVNKSSPDCL